MLYMVVLQAVLLFGLYLWFISAEIDRTVKDIHTDFMWKITGNQARRKPDRTWMTLAEG